MEKPKISRILALLALLAMAVGISSKLSVALGVLQLPHMPEMMEQHTGAVFPVNFDFEPGTAVSLAVSCIWALPYLVLCLLQMLLKRTGTVGGIVLAVLSAISLAAATLLQAVHDTFAVTGVEDEFSRSYLYMAITWLSTSEQLMSLLSAGLLCASFAIQFYALRQQTALPQSER